MEEPTVISRVSPRILQRPTALYRIEQNNILVNTGAQDNPDLLRQIGQQQAKGGEVEMYGNIRPNFNVTANFSYNVATITGSDDLEEIGSLMPNASKSQGNIWMRYNFVRNALEGIGVALDTNYACRCNLHQ